VRGGNSPLPSLLVSGVSEGEARKSTAKVPGGAGAVAVKVWRR